MKKYLFLFFFSLFYLFLMNNSILASGDYVSTRPVIQISFDDYSDNKVLNMVPSENKEGILMNDASISTPLQGKFRSALILNNQNENNQYFLMPNSLDFDRFDDTITIQAWINPTEVTNPNQRIISKWSSEDVGQRSFTLWVSFDKLRFVLSEFGTDNKYALISNTSIPANQWTHVAAVSDGERMKTYINNELVSEAPSPQSIHRSSTPLVMGQRDQTGSGQGFDGLIDEVYIYNVSLSDFDKHYTVSAPSIVEIGETFPVHVVVMHESGYPIEVSNDIIHFLPSDGITGLPGSYSFNQGGSFVEFNDVRCTKEGTYYAVLKVEGDNMYAKSNPIVCQNSDTEFKIYWGDIHWHSNLGLEKNGGYHAKESPEYGYEFARDISNLDFTSLAEHAFRLKYPMADWEEIIDQANIYHDKHNFVTILSHEWAGRNGGGYSNSTRSDDHHIIRFRGNLNDPDLDYIAGVNVPVLSYPGVPYYSTITPNPGWVWEDSDTLEEAWDLVKQYGATITPHHLRFHTLSPEEFLSYGILDYQNMMPYIEIYSKWGASEYIDNPRTTKAQEAAQDMNIDPHMVTDALTGGLKIGFVASSDSHYTVPGSIIDESKGYANLQYKSGLTAVYAEELSRKAIWDALTNRRTYATSSKKIFIHFSINGHMMGEEFATSDPLNIKVKAAGTTHFKMEIIKNNQVIDSRDIDDMETEFTYTDTEFTNNSWYYIRLTQIDGERAWASPIWVNTCDRNCKQETADLNDDGKVDLFDLVFITSRFSFTQSSPGWNATADIIQDNEIDIYDMVFVASIFT